MAPKLPSVRDLGGLPNVGGSRPVAVADASALSAGAAALGKGIMQLGAGVADYEESKGHYEYAQANADFLTKKIELDQRYDTDTDYTTRKERYDADIGKLQAEAAERITSPAMRERFALASKVEVAKWSAAQEDVARKQEHEKQYGYVLEQGDKFIDQGTGAASDDTRRAVGASYGALVDGLKARNIITEAKARDMKNDWARRFAVTDLNRRAETDPDGVINTLRAAPGTPDAIVGRILTAEGDGKNPRSSARGTGQFIDSTWLDVIKRNKPELAAGRSDQEILALRADKSLAREMTDVYRRENVASLKSQGIDAPTAGQQYLAHFLGAGGAAAVIKADPNMPIGDALAKAVGQKKAQEMIDANPEVLRGKLAGSVAAWADGKMGGSRPGGSPAYDYLQPDVREEILSRARTALDKRTVNDRASFEASVNNATQEAYSTGRVTKPISLGDFVEHYGADAGTQRYKEYEITVETGRAISAMATMPAAERTAVVERLRPEPGDPNYALKIKAHGIAEKAAAQVDKAISQDPAGFAAERLPATGEAFANMRNALGNPAASAGDRAAAAGHYATVTLSEQERLGVPVLDRRILPKDYVDQFNARMTNPAASGGSLNIAGMIQSEAQLWGDKWPMVYRELAKEAQPVVRVVGSGVKPAAAQILTEVAKIPLNQILKDQDEEKFSTVKKEVLTAFKPLAATMLGNEGAVRVFNDFREQGEKLAAYHVMHGMSASDGAAKAFEDLVGFKYDFNGKSYRVPKDIPYSADAIGAGVAAATDKMGELNVEPASDTVGGLSGDYLKRATASAYARDGVWVTAPDENGLALIYKDRAVRRSDGKPLVLSWAELNDLGRAKAWNVNPAAFGMPLSDMPELTRRPASPAR